MREFIARQRAWVCALALLLAMVVAPSARGQIAPQLDLGGPTEVGGEAERYLRALAITSTVTNAPWTALPFPAAMESTLRPRAAHPWQSRFDSAAHRGPLTVLRPAASLTLNTSYPFQASAGPAWTGRGMTVVVQGGVRAQWGPVGVQLAPVAFLAQNAAFPLAPNGATGIERFGDARFPFNIDYPQRFGESMYGRVDLGTSSITLESARVTAGLSNAPQRWGPASAYPLVLGPASGGFPHAFFGTAQPVDLKIASLQLRYIAGTLPQSSYSPAPADRAHRIASGAILGITPRGVDGLEVGFTRFFESTEPLTIGRVLRPFSLRALVGAIGDTTSNVANENQVASAFFRWVFPASGAEVYGEWFREDFPGDLRKLLLKPDDLSSFTLGVQHVLVASSTRRRVLRFEIVNGELSHQERGQRGNAQPIPPYLHFQVLQGHTNRGLLLGSPAAYGGAGWRFAHDTYDVRGRFTVGVERALRFDWLPGQPTPATDVHPDVMYAVRAEMLRFAGARDYTVTVVPAIDLNRNLVRGADRLNLNAAVGIRGW